MGASKKTKVTVLFLATTIFIFGIIMASLKAFFPHLIDKKNNISVSKKYNFIDDGKIHIVLDAGHGGFDPGASNKKVNIQEKTITLQIVKAIEAIADTSKYTILLTRNADTNVHRHHRIEMAEAFKTNLLVSIHCNSFFQSDINGFEIGYSDSILKPKDSISICNPYKSTCLGISDTLSKNIGYVFPQMKNRGLRIRKDRIWMIYAGNFPSILVEWGYITNPYDITIMKDPIAQQHLAQAIWQSINHHFGLLKS